MMHQIAFMIACLFLLSFAMVASFLDSPKAFVEIGVKSGHCLWQGACDAAWPIRFLSPSNVRSM
jgi:hypothetical protein